MKKDQLTLFIVDDDKILSTRIKNEIKRNFPEESFIVYSFETGELCNAFLKNAPDIAIIDYHLNSKYKDAMNGIEILDVFKEKSPDTHLILFTQEDSIGLAVEAFDHGAQDYVVKNEFMLRRLNLALVQCLKIRDIKKALILKHSGLLTRVIKPFLLGSFTAIVRFFSPSYALHKTN